MTRGSAAIAAWIAHLAFWIILVWGWAIEELGARGVVVFLLLWVAGWIGLPYVRYGDGLFSSYVAVLDVALVFVVVKGDVRLR